jgi:hypothetical protein
MAKTNAVCFNHECGIKNKCSRYQAQMPEADCVTHNFTPEGANCVGFLDYPEMYKFLIK